MQRRQLFLLQLQHQQHSTAKHTAIILMTSNYSCLQVCMGSGGAESLASHMRKFNKSYETFSDPKYAHIPEVHTVNAGGKREHFMQQARLYVETIWRDVCRIVASWDSVIFMSPQRVTRMPHQHRNPDRSTHLQKKLKKLKDWHTTQLKWYHRMWNISLQMAVAVLEPSVAAISLTAQAFTWHCVILPCFGNKLQHLVNDRMIFRQSFFCPSFW